MDFELLVKGVHDTNDIPGVPHSLLSLDPGHTTGWAFFEGIEQKWCGQVKSDSLPAAAENIGELFVMHRPAVIVIEDYRIYKWKKDEHVGSDMLTTRVIGCIETMAIMSDTPLFKQSAQVAKNFCTDKKLKEWDFYVKGQRHARDALRHGAYFLIFGPNKKADKDFYRDTTTLPI